MAEILVLDDEPFVAKAAMRLLERAGHSVVVCGTPAAAIEMIEGGGFDLLLSDVQMPGMSGPEVVETLRERQIHLPVILMSGDVGPWQTQVFDLLRRGVVLALVDKGNFPDALRRAVAAAFPSRD